MHRPLLILLLTQFVWGDLLSCTGGTNAGTLNPTASFATATVNSGQYFTINAVCGYTYTFSFCNGGGSATFDTQITINQTNNTTQLAYNDDSSCGLQSEVTWTATSTQTIHVLVSQYNCNNSGAVSGTLAYMATPPSLSYTIGCTSAVPSVSGGCSNTFSFNPVPSDGATIDPATGFISNATSGASYTVNFAHAGGNQSVGITMGNPPCYTLNGDASYINVAGQNCIELTAAQNDQTGCAWAESLIDFNSDFSLSLDYYFGNNAGGADGTTFTFQPNPSACGASGAQLGAGGISNALIVEFDTYDNDGAAGNDLSCDHIAVETDSDLPDDPANFPANSPPYCGPVCAINGGGSIENGSTHFIEITWNATTQQLDIFFDGNNRLSCSGDFVNTVFGGDNLIYWGATAATGGLNNQQYFCPETVILLPAGIVQFDSHCTNGQASIDWTAASEINLDHYTLEYTTDGLLFLPYANVNAYGGTTYDAQHYSIDIDARTATNGFFRLKSYDMDGSIQTSDLIRVVNCSESGNLFSLSGIYSGQLVLESANGQDFEFTLLDANGKRIQQGSSSNGVVRQVTTIPQGIYFLYANFSDGLATTLKLPVYH